jgi:integrase
VALTDTAIRKAKRAEKPKKLFDERGLFLLISPTGGKLWRFKYRFAGKEKLIGLGAYPDVSLADARGRRDEARKRVAAGVDPSEERRASRVATCETFELVAREWFDKFKSQWTEGHRRTIIGRMEDNLFPFIGSKAVRDLTAPDVLTALRRIEARGANETARRVRQICGQVFRYAVATGRALRDPSADLKGALAPVEVRNHAAITDPKKLGPLLRVLDGYDGTLIVKCALRLAPLVFVRPGELRHAQWSEIDLENGEWTIPAWRMKMKQTLTVPLAAQAISIMRELQPLTGHGKYVFPSGRGGSRPMSNNAVLAGLRRSGIEKDEMSGHGFRATARTILDEVLHERVDLIEHQLGHAVKDPNGRAYNRTAFLKDRKAMMQRWANYLDSLKATDAHAHSA